METGIVAIFSLSLGYFEYGVDFESYPGVYASLNEIVLCSEYPPKHVFIERRSVFFKWDASCSGAC